MSIQYTPEQLAATKINKRNYSTVLGVIYYLDKLSTSSFSNPYIAVQNYVYTSVGEGAGTTATFNALSGSSFAKGATITLTGTATFNRILGAATILTPTLSLTAHIDSPANNGNIPQVVYANGANINPTTGAFSFTIPAEVTSKLAAGNHTVYIIAQSPKGLTKLTGGTDGVRTFTIT